MGRKSLAEVEARRKDVLEMMVLGKSNSHIISWCATNYGVGRSTVENDIIACHKDMKRLSDEDKESTINLHVNRYELIFERALELSDFRDGLAALAAKEKLMRLHQEQPLVQINTLNVSGYTDEQLLAIKKALGND